MRIRKAVSQLSTENYKILAREILAEAFVRFPVLEYLVCMSTDWENPDYVIDHAVEVHETYWDDDPDAPVGYSLDRIKNELVDCFEALLRRKLIPENLKKFKSGRVHTDIERRHAEFLAATKDILELASEDETVLVEADFVEFLLNLLTVLQYTRYEKEEDRQLWDFLFALSTKPKQIINNKSWSISTIVEILNQDNVAPQLEPWDEIAVTNLRDRFRRFCLASMQVAIRQAK